jgi:hypothetical protein
MSTTVAGGCLCGAIRYLIAAPVATLRVCHCLNCQKASGTGGTVNAVVPTDSFRITEGHTRKYDDSATESGRTLSRHFCGDCGSPIYSHRNPNPGFVVVRAGTLDDSSALKIAAHIWTSRARAWDHIDPATERHPGNMPAPAPSPKP